MPTYEWTSAFADDYRRLSIRNQDRFLSAVRAFVWDLLEIEAGDAYKFRPGLRVKGVRGVPGLFEMSWAPDGRATFSWDEAARPGKRHVVWHRCGDHSILP